MMSLILLLLTTAWAETRLTVDKAVQMALDHSYQIDGAEAGEVKARAEATEAVLQHFPKASIAGGYTRLDQAPYVEFDTSDFLGGGGGTRRGGCTP